MLKLTHVQKATIYFDSSFVFLASSRLLYKVYSPWFYFSVHYHYSRLLAKCFEAVLRSFFSKVSILTSSYTWIQLVSGPWAQVFLKHTHLRHDIRGFRFSMHLQSVLIIFKHLFIVSILLWTRLMSTVLGEHNLSLPGDDTCWHLPLTLIYCYYCKKG